jgi:3-oxoacyl-[acyl-carrier protein] reductase
VDGSLAGRAALVTGVSRRAGIGFATASRLLQAGARVFVQSWSHYDVATPWGAEPGGIDQVLSELRTLGDVGHLEADFADPEGPLRVVTAATHALGHLDILVVNHAFSERGGLEELTVEQLDHHLAVNVRASLLLVKEFAARHEGREGGRVVLLVSGQHLGPMSDELAYATSKGALQQATRSLAHALAERGITVNAVNPGPTDTGWGLGDRDPRAQMPLGRWGKPDDAARLVAWLCSDEARWLTGQTIDSEGGFRRSG